jgi:sugar lactone lactonase YvrE
MKKVYLPSMAIAAVLLSSSVNAQSNKAFAVTSETKGSFNWTVVREIDLGTGEVIRTLYDPSVNKKVIYDAAVAEARIANNVGQFAYPTAQGVAAAAFDADHNRLYFTNMRGYDLRYFDLNSGETRVVINNDMKFNTGVKYDEANVITRMTFASDGFGYALTNDGKSLVKFTTDQKPVVTNLGELIDAKGATISVHSQCSSWGGDMVGDAYGNLYLVSMRNHIFKINTQTRITEYVGQIKGLPSEFTSNGMAVDNDGNLVVSSAVISSNYYRVNISTLEAVEIKKDGENIYNASDLANSNLLYKKKSSNELISRAEVKGNYMVSVYPNPVTNKFFNVQFDRLVNGQYTLSLTDVSGRLVYEKALNINVTGQMEKINLPRGAGGGMYLVKLTGSDSKVVYSDKIVVQ